MGFFSRNSHSDKMNKRDFSTDFCVVLFLMDKIESLKVETASVSPAFVEAEEKNIGSPNMGEILDEMHRVMADEPEAKENSGGAASEPEKMRYRLVKRKPERRKESHHNEPAGKENFSFEKTKKYKGIIIIRSAQEVAQSLAVYPILFLHF